MDLAFLKNECTICYEKLSDGPISKLCREADSQLRACCHLYHTTCINEYRTDCITKHISVLECPYCRIAYNHAEPIPSVQLDPISWFRHMDTNGDGNLSYDELLTGLKSQIDANWQAIECDVDRFWAQWDKDRNQAISLEEFANVETGVIAYLQQNYPYNPRGLTPDILTSREDWFNYWDENFSNTLEKIEITRALIKTLKIYGIPQEDVFSTVESIWPLFDEDGSGVIEKSEFLQEDNFADSICAAILDMRRRNHTHSTDGRVF